MLKLFKYANGESNPGRQIGNLSCYHYTISVFSATGVEPVTNRYQRCFKLYSLSLYQLSYAECAVYIFKNSLNKFAVCKQLMVDNRLGLIHIFHHSNPNFLKSYTILMLVNSLNPTQTVIILCVSSSNYYFKIVGNHNHVRPHGSIQILYTRICGTPRYSGRKAPFLQGPLSLIMILLFDPYTLIFFLFFKLL